MKKIVSTSEAPAAVGAYSQGVRVGQFVYTAGQIPLDPKTGQLVSGDISAQAKRVMENLRAILAAENLNFGHVVKTTIFLADINDFQAVNEVYSAYFTAAPPARSTFAVAALPKGARVEIECIASADASGGVASDTSG